MNHRKIAWNAVNYGPTLMQLIVAILAALGQHWYTAMLVGLSALCMFLAVRQTRSWFAIGYLRGSWQTRDEINGLRDPRPHWARVPEPWEPQLKMSQIVAMARDYQEPRDDD